MRLSVDTEQLIDQHLALGIYASADELLREALSALRDRDDDLAALQAGLADLEAGRVLSLDDVAEEIRAKHSFRNA